MELEDDTGDPFGIPDLWKPASQAWTDLDIPTVYLPSLNLDGEQCLALQQTFCSRPNQDLRDVVLAPGGLPDLNLPNVSKDLTCDLDNFSWGPLPELEVIDELSSSSDLDHESDCGDIPGDIWLDTNGSQEIKTVIHYSWEAFNNHSLDVPSSVYLSESDPGAYDALIDSTSLVGCRAPQVRLEALLCGLFELGLGRSSLLFRYDESEGIFESILGDLRLPGINTTTVGSLCDDIKNCGSQTRYLRNAIEGIYSNGRHSSAHIALAKAVSVILATVEASTSAARSEISTILQLQHAFRRPILIVRHIHELFRIAYVAKDDQHLLSILHDTVTQLEHKSGWLGSLLREIFSRVATPWLESVSDFIGLTRQGATLSDESELRRGFIRMENQTCVHPLGAEETEDRLSLDIDKLPSFIPKDEARLILETGKSLLLLKTHQPDHPLTTSAISSSTLVQVEHPSLEWNYDWERIRGIERRCKIYQESVVAAVRQYSQGTASNPGRLAYLGSSLSSRASGGVWAHDFGLDRAIDAPLPDLLATSSDELRNLVVRLSTPTLPALTVMPSTSHSNTKFSTVGSFTSFYPPSHVTALLSLRPPFITQRHLLSTATLRLLLHTHSLRHHLTLQYQTHLLASPSLLELLVERLFSSNLASAECQHGIHPTGGVMGLRLGHRTSWPPSSSELRLALMGILSDAASEAPMSLNNPLRAHLDDPLGGLSFAVRDMTPAELSQCRDASSIHALDFLRLQYRPPPPLSTVITPSSLQKYDQLFQQLLRVLRTQHAVLSLVHSTFLPRHNRPPSHSHFLAQRFRIEAHHFLSCITHHYHSTVVYSLWQVFDRQLHDLESRLATGNNRDDSIELLRRWHEHTLDRMLTAALLRKRQNRALTVLLRTFTAILRFVGLITHEGLLPAPENAHLLSLYYDDFTTGVHSFIAHLREMSEESPSRQSTGAVSTGGGSSSAHGYASDKVDADIDDDITDTAGNDLLAGLLLRLEMNGWYAT